MTARLRIGLTGGIASGKSTAAERFSQLGVAVIDADAASRAVVAPGTPGLAALTQRFGTALVLADGNLDRAALRALIFADAAARREVNAVLHPLIRERMEREAAAAAGPYVVLMIPLLVESGDARARVDRVLLVDIDERVQRERLLARDGITRAQADAILAAQAGRAARLALADDVIRNEGTVEELRRQVDVQHARYLDLAHARETRT